MGYIVTILYMIVLGYWLTRMQWLGQAGFGKRFVVGLFVAKCLAGFAYNFVALKFIPNRGDIWPFFEDGLAMYHRFWASPAHFFHNFPGLQYGSGDGFGSDSGLVRSAFELIKLLHFGLDFFTLGNLQANTVIFNFALVLCSLYSWRLFKRKWPERGLLAGAVFFLLPSMFFYTSAVHKEGLQLGLVCLLIPLTHRLLKRPTIKSLLSWLVVFFALFLIKFFVAFSWLACTLLWVALVRFPKGKKWVLPSFGLLAVAVFMGSGIISPKLGMPAFLAKKQAEFLAMPAASSIPLKVITEDPTSFAKALPFALNNVLFKPLPGEGGKAMYLAFTAEMVGFWLLMFLIFIKRKKGRPQAANGLLAPAMVLLCFALINLVVIGFTIPNVGAIIRYRSIFMPCLALFAVVSFGGWPKPESKLERLLAC